MVFFICWQRLTWLLELLLSFGSEQATEIKPDLMSPLWQGKCPRCAVGHVFKHPLLNPHFAAMHNECPNCQATFQPEPGFYFGAMFVSYAITVVIMAISSLFLWLFFKAGTNVYIVTFLFVTILFMPVSYRFSRLIWLYWFGGHKRFKKR